MFHIIDYERISRKSNGSLKGYLKSICFYYKCFFNTVKRYGIIKAVILYSE